MFFEGRGRLGCAGQVEGMRGRRGGRSSALAVAVVEIDSGEESPGHSREVEKEGRMRCLCLIVGYGLLPVGLGARPHSRLAYRLYKKISMVEARARDG